MCFISMHSPYEVACTTCAELFTCHTCRQQQQLLICRCMLYTTSHPQSQQCTTVWPTSSTTSCRTRWLLGLPSSTLGLHALTLLFGMCLPGNDDRAGPVMATSAVQCSHLACAASTNDLNDVGVRPSNHSIKPWHCLCCVMIFILLLHVARTILAHIYVLCILGSMYQARRAACIPEGLGSDCVPALARPGPSRVRFLIRQPQAHEPVAQMVTFD